MVGVVILALIVGGAIGAAGSSEKSKLEDVEKELASAEKKVETRDAAMKVAQTEASEADDRAAKIEGEATKIVSQSEDKADEIVGDAKAEAAELDNIDGEIESAESKLSEIQESIGGAQEEKRLSTIPGDGTFQAEVDYLPGVYKSSGGNLCYWATLNSADNFDIANNENATGPTIAEITTPYFQTQGCGKWTRVSE